MNDHMKAMNFDNPTQREGENCTVRQGTKWAELKIGEEFELHKTDGPTIGIGTVTALKITTFNNIDAFDIRLSNNPANINVMQLFAELERVYPSFKTDGVVTIVYYTWKKL